MAARAEFHEILGALHDGRVNFVLVGGLSAVLQGSPINTVDVDIVPALDAENARRLRSVLDAMGAHPRLRPELHDRPTEAELQTDAHHLLTTQHGPLDVLGCIGNGIGFDDLAEACITVDLEGRSILVQSLESLIRVKEQVGGDKDRLVLPVLRATLEERRRSESRDDESTSGADSGP